MQPFTNIDVHSNYGIRCCSESWMPTWIGDFSKKTIGEIWNSQIIIKIRQSILDGTYEFCDWHQCPFYSNDEYYLFSEFELRNPESLSPVRKNKLVKLTPWIEYILRKKTILDKMPANYNLAYDESCNLKCPSCRNIARIFLTGPEYEKRVDIHNKLINEISTLGFDTIGRLNITGSGEPFVSRIFKGFLYQFDPKSWPNLDINIQSNGIFFTKDAWNKMSKIQKHINEVIISLDASNAETYSKIRVNGNYSKLIRNIEHLAFLRSENKIKRLMLAFVVQKENYKEMKDVIVYAKTIKADLIIFNLLNDWKSWPVNEYESNAIWKKFHPMYSNFIDILKDPVFLDPIVDLGNLLEYKKSADLTGNVI